MKILLLWDLTFGEFRPFLHAQGGGKTVSPIGISRKGKKSKKPDSNTGIRISLLREVSAS